ncbi:hypothetical protein [Variovorax paradoxus]|uniref:hypothetical protein n=1 Tax=Variovorax paradoxus TaxID=34073 RepID=UPI003D650299
MKNVTFKLLMTGLGFVLSFNASSLSIKNQFFEILEIHSNGGNLSEDDIDKLKRLQGKASEYCSRETGAVIVVSEAVLADEAIAQNSKNASTAINAISSWLVSAGFLEKMIFPRVVSQKIENERRASLGQSPLINSPNTVIVNVACDPPKRR